MLNMGHSIMYVDNLNFPYNSLSQFCGTAVTGYTH
jgi:hypothetical protein